MSTGEFAIRFPTFYSAARLLKDWGWLIVVVWLALGFRVRTPADQAVELSSQLARVQAALQVIADSVYAIRDAQRSQAMLVDWTVSVSCRGLTRAELLISLPCKSRR